MDPVVFVIAGGLFALSVASGMLGLGVAFAAFPFLGFFLPDLVHQLQPLNLFLNGVTALFAAFGFARSRLVEWRPAILLTIVAAITRDPRLLVEARQYRLPLRTVGKGTGQREVHPLTDRSCWQR